MSCEIESMFAEDLFYKYLIDKGYELQDQNKTRKINIIDFYNKTLVLFILSISKKLSVPKIKQTLAYSFPR